MSQFLLGILKLFLLAAFLQELTIYDHKIHKTFSPLSH